MDREPPARLLWQAFATPPDGLGPRYFAALAWDGRLIGAIVHRRPDTAKSPWHYQLIGSAAAFGHHQTAGRAMGAATIAVSEELGLEPLFLELEAGLELEEEPAPAVQPWDVIYGAVHGSGGGVVPVVVDRDTASYPNEGERVALLQAAEYEELTRLAKIARTAIRAEVSADLHSSGPDPIDPLHPEAMARMMQDAALYGEVRFITRPQTTGPHPGLSEQRPPDVLAMLRRQAGWKPTWRARIRRRFR